MARTVVTLLLHLGGVYPVAGVVVPLAVAVVPHLLLDLPVKPP